MNSISFTVYCTPQPQGSSKGFIVRRPNGKQGVAITSDNSRLKPFRHQVAQVAALKMRQNEKDLPFGARHVPVMLTLVFYLEKPHSAPKKRKFPVVKPDSDKLARSCLDSLAGIIYADDAQVVSVQSTKLYGSPERVEITAQLLEE